MTPIEPLTANKRTAQPASAARRAKWPWLVVLAVGISAAAAWATSRAITAAADRAAAAKANPTETAAFNYRFAPTKPNAAGAPAESPAGMTWIPGGEFSMGCEYPDDFVCSEGEAMFDARPIHRVYVDGFWMDKTDVTNEQFAKFVAATGYVTIAEQKPKAEDVPMATADQLVPGSLVFTPPCQRVPLDDYRQWWRYQNGADWRHPQGPGSDIKGREKYPVVQVAYPDAVAYAHWAGKRLPTEAEWEFAARGGLSGKLYAWGDDFRPAGKYMANTFQGVFPVQDDGLDGFRGLAPVAQFPPNGYGLFDMAGNVWQWCSDWYGADYYRQLAATGRVTRNPTGPADSYDPTDSASVELNQKKHVERGGSFLCTEEYCSRYIVGSRGKGETNSATDHLGFRCVQSPTDTNPKR